MTTLTKPTQWFRTSFTVLALACVWAQPAVAVDHPFLIWTRDEAKELRDRIAKDPDAKAQLDRMAATEISKGNPVLWNLFRYLVLEDQAAGESELRALRGFMGQKPEPMTWNVDLKTLKWNVGNSSQGDAHMRDEQTLNVLRYDVLYDKLTAEERARIEQSFRDYIEFHLAGHPPTHPDFKYSRVGWLPNMHWPRAIGTHIMAVAMKDEELIRNMFNSQGGWKWYLDDYLADGRFYMEEFNKVYSNIGSMLMYCEGLERLGLGKYGYGYTGKGGATMRRHLGMMIDIGLPRLAWPDATTPAYPMVTMGDAGRSGHLINSINQTRLWRDNKGNVREEKTTGTGWWSSRRMNGPLPKLLLPGWFEIGHRRWPDAGFDYFLAQLRGPGETRYLPSLYWGLRPIDAAKVKPPPAPSYVARERGFAMLRMEEGPGYWESARPVAVQQFGMYYVHYVHDCFSLLHYEANNRMLYTGMGREPQKVGYAGGDGWVDHARGHNTVCVDGLQGKPTDNGENGTANHRLREHLAGPARFVAARTTGIFPDVTQERMLVLTDQYLLDLFHLTSNRERVYDWQVMTEGQLQDEPSQNWKPLEQDPARKLLVQPRRWTVDNTPWSVSLQLPDVGASKGAGVRVRMLPEPGTMVQVSRPPETEPGEGSSLLVSRQAASTMFAALHEPFTGGLAGRVDRKYEALARTDNALAVLVTGKDCNDRILMAHGEDVAQKQKLSAGKESYAFTGYAFVRVGAEHVEAVGHLQACTIPVTGSPKFTLNGKDTPIIMTDHCLVYRSE